jgi:glycosyltransferase involved in cell wall biosynthesis
MLLISVVIITKNESINISPCIRAAKQIADEIIVVDTGSSDNTVELAKKENVRVYEINWEGYGHARNYATSLAHNDWIFAIDADERVTVDLAKSFRMFCNPDNMVIYGFKRESYFLGKKIRFGNFGADKVYRIYNKSNVSWNLAEVHETLVGNNINKELIKGHLEHYTIRSLEENENKIINYANLNAQKYFAKRKRSTIIKRYLSPLFAFVQPYFLRFGFLDGRAGFLVSYSNAKCTWLKYQYLYKMYKSKKVKEEESC